MEKKTVIQFNENHKWCGCFGYIHSLKAQKYYMIAVPIPSNEKEKGTNTAFIYAGKEDFDVIGKTDLILGDDE